MEAGPAGAQGPSASRRNLRAVSELDASVDRQAEVARLYGDGHNTHEIAAMLGWGTTTIQRDVRKLGIARAPGRPEK